MCKKLNDENCKLLFDIHTCFIFLSSLNIDYKPDINKAESLMDSVNGDKVPGLKAQIIASYILIYTPSDSKLKNLLNVMINHTLDCEGIKGRPQFIKRVIEKHSNHLNSIDLNKINTWIKTYVELIIEDIKEIEEYYFMEFDKNPKLLKCNLNICHGVCCYDGVYLSKEDEKNIKKFIEENKSEFIDLPNKFIVNSNWKNIIRGRKTATRNRTSNTEHYPKHFNKTICVFADDNGFCRLQSLATKLAYHPWKYKPTTCWNFPLTILDAGEIISPPKKEDRDPCCYDESYPGYIKFLPCGKPNESGIPWYKIYKQEIIWNNFLFIKNK